MEQIYSVGPDTRQLGNWLKDRKALNVAVSCRNAVAFTSTRNLIARSKLPQYQREYFVYVCDIDKPWDLYLISQYDEEITHIEWHVGGTQLILVTASGAVQLWSMKDYLLDQWECTSTTKMPLEQIVTISWLHTWTQVNYNVEKKDMTLYTEKVVPLRFAASLTQFGGKPTGGWIAITQSGLICVGTITSSGSGIKVSVQKVPLSPTNRHHISRADIGYSSSGEIIISASDGSISSAIHCYAVNLKMVNESCQISSKSRGGFHLKCQPEFRDANAQISHVRFPFPEDPNSVVIDVGSGTNSSCELWSFQEQKHIVHHVFQMSGDTKPSSTHKWQHQVSLNNNSPMMALAATRLPVIQSVPESSLLLLQGIALAYKDGSVKIVHKRTFQVLSTYSLKSKSSEVGDKRVKTQPYVISCQLSLTGCCLICLDSFGALNLISVAGSKDIGTAMGYLLPLLEYCMYAGYDWYDLLVCLKPNVVDSVVQRLQDNFNKQAPLVQNMTSTKLLAMKASLYNLLGANQPKACDSRCKLLLVCVCDTFHAMLAPKAITSLDISTGDKLSQICSRSTEADLGKLLMTLDQSEFHIDSSTLQSMQHLIQWVGDFTLYLLAAVPIFQMSSNTPGASFFRDAKSLSMLRELLVIIRMNTTILPVFMCSTSSLDIVSMLFKLVTKLWLSVCDSSSMEPDESFVEECCVIPGKIFVPSIDQCLLADLTSHPSVVHQHQLVQCPFGEHPSHLARPSSMQHLSDVTTLSNRKRDMLRQINIGKVPASEMRRCSRCNLISLLKTPMSTPVSLAWDQRWAKICLCGGQWVTFTEEVES